MANTEEDPEIFVGNVFESFDDLEEALKRYGESNHCSFIKHDSKRLKALDGYNYITYACKRGMKRPSQSKGLRRPKCSLKSDCPVCVRATSTITTNGITYKISKAELLHNHETSSQLLFTQRKRQKDTFSGGMDLLELTFLGTASAYPSPHRCVSCTALHHDNGIWLFDCGEGSQIQLMKSQLKAGKINKIFITHLHGDHLYGLPGLLCTISRNNLRKDPVEIYGPMGLRDYLCTTLHHSKADIDFTFSVIELETIPCQESPTESTLVMSSTDTEAFWAQRMLCAIQEPRRLPLVPSEVAGRTVKADEKDIWHLYSDDKVSVSAVWLQHRIPCFGYVIQESDRPGKLNAAMLKALGVPPGPLFAKIKSGKSIELENGQTILPEDVVSKPTPGRCLIIGGDSCDSNELKKLGSNATVMVHEATLENSRRETCVQNGHSTPEMTATLAKEMNVGTLILFHLSQRYKPLGAVVHDGEKSAQIILDEARQILPHDKVFLAEDLMTFKIQGNKIVQC